jgi:hypothetical protein
MSLLQCYFNLQPHSFCENFSAAKDFPCGFSLTKVFFTLNAQVIVDEDKKEFVGVLCWQKRAYTQFSIQKHFSPHNSQLY